MCQSQHSRSLISLSLFFSGNRLLLRNASRKAICLKITSAMRHHNRTKPTNLKQCHFCESSHTLRKLRTPPKKNFKSVGSQTGGESSSNIFSCWHDMKRNMFFDGKWKRNGWADSAEVKNKFSLEGKFKAHSSSFLSLISWQTAKSDTNSPKFDSTLSYART